MMAEDAAPRHATTLPSLHTVHHKLGRAHPAHDFPLRKQGAVISLSGSRERDRDRGVDADAADASALGAPRRGRGDRMGSARSKLRKISTLSVPEGRDAKDVALVLLHNGNHGDAACFLAEDSAEDDDDEDEEDDDEHEEDDDEHEVDDDVDEEDEDTAALEAEAAGSGRHRVPDGGWGWAVVAAAFFINMASDGISFSFGLLYIEFLRYFGESRSTTSWIGSLFMAVPMLTGPVASAMVDRYGCRAMTIVGGVVSAIGFVVAASSSTIGQMYLTFGVLAGLGLGLCFITAVVSIAYWFERKRTLAMSLGAAGTGFGTFIYAPMTNYFISEYGWRGTVLLLAGTFLNLCVCGVVMRDPTWWAAEQRQQQRRQGAGRGAVAARAGLAAGGAAQGGVGPGSDAGLESAELLPRPPITPLAVPLSRVARSLPYTRPMAMAARSEDNLASLAALLPTRHAASAPQTPSTPTTPFSTFNTIHELHDEPASTPDAPGSTPLLGPRGALLLPLAPGPAAAAAAAAAGDGRGPGAVASAVAGIVAASASVPVPVRRSNSCSPFGGSPLRAESLPCFRRRVSLSAATPLCAAPSAPPCLASGRGRRRTSSFKDARSSWTSCCPSLGAADGDADKAKGKRWYSDTVELVRAMLDFSLFLELHFLLMSVGTTLLYTWFVVPYFYLADHLTRNGYTEAEASRLLGVVGVANTVGMVVLGWVGDHPRLNVTKTYALCLAVCGTATAAMLVLTDRYWLLVAACASFGVTFASTFSFTPTILVTLVPMERFTIAYGLNLLCQGIGNLLGPPFAGWLFDLTHSWDWSFYMAGFWIVVAGVLTGLISYTNNRHFFGSLQQQQQQQQQAVAVASAAPPGTAAAPASEDAVVGAADADLGSSTGGAMLAPSKSTSTVDAAGESCVP